MTDKPAKCGRIRLETAWAICVGLGLALTGVHCGGGMTAPVLLSLAVSPVSPNLVVGTTQQFTATGSYTAGSTRDLTSSVIWTSSDPKVVTVSASGLAAVKVAGSVTITAIFGLVSGSTQQLTAALKLESISVSPASVSIPLGLSQQFTATGAYSDQSKRDITRSATWSSSNLAVATITSSGLATSAGTGTATITAKAASVSGSSDTGDDVASTPAVLTVNAAVSVSVTPATASLTVGQTEQFTAAVANASNSKVTWSVDGVPGGNATVGTISSSGLYQTPAGPGAHAIQATSQTDPTKNAQANITISYAGMLTYHNDIGRTGQDLNETILTPSNVNSTQFGKLIAYPVDGAIYAQPLYVQSVTIPNQGVHNVVYVVTQHDSVYAFDADGKASSALWQVSFINPAGGITPVPPPPPDDAYPGGEIGVASTPVIDPATGTLYVVAYTLENGQHVYRLHALDVASGTEKFGGPVLIQALVPGTGAATNGQGQVPFDPTWHLQRSALLLLNGTVYVTFASHGDLDPYHGWLIGFDAHTLTQVSVFNATPNGTRGGIWQSGAGPAADTSGNIYLMTGNGTFDASSGGLDYGDTVLKLSADDLSVVGYFTPFDQANMAAIDQDLGSGGPLVLPDQTGPSPHLLVGAGKKSTIYLIDRDDLGGFNAQDDSQIVQSIPNAAKSGFLSSAAFWQNYLYFVGVNDPLKQYRVSQGYLSVPPTAMSSATFSWFGSTPSISANGSTNGIAWVVTIGSGSSKSGGPAALYAFDATDVSHELYNSEQVPARDQAGNTVKFSVPTIMNGKVYVGTTSELDIFGLLGK